MLKINAQMYQNLSWLSMNNHGEKSVALYHNLKKGFRGPGEYTLTNSRLPCVRITQKLFMTPLRYVTIDVQHDLLLFPCFSK